MMLTDTKLRNAMPKELPYRLTDGHGLYVLINPSGAKLWRWKYRFMGKEKLMSFGSYPELPLADARAAQAEGRKLLAAGKDSMAEKKANILAPELALGRKCDVNHCLERAVRECYN